MLKNTFVSVTVCLIAVAFLVSSCSAGLFSREKEVKDEYLTKLFEPHIPYESIKVMEDSTGSRFIVIKTKEKLIEKDLSEYDDLLLSRSVNIYGSFHHGLFSWQQTVTDYAITITRKVEGEPDTIEISESVVKDPKKNEPIVATSAKGREIRIAIEKDFGKKWKKIKLMPDKEPEAPEPKVGRAHGARLVSLKSLPSGTRYYIFISKAPLKQIYDYYSGKLNEQYPFAKEMFSNPKAYSHTSIKLLGIKTTGREFRLTFYNKTPKGILGSIEVISRQSIDPNLSDYIQIDIMED